MLFLFLPTRLVVALAAAPALLHPWRQSMKKNVLGECSIKNNIRSSFFLVSYVE